jgi:UDP-glucose 4-epimerase
MVQKPATCLVTGGAGFIGRHVASHLLKAGNVVIVVDDLSGGYLENLPAGVQFHRGSITDEHFVHAVFNQYSIQYVFHLAAYAAESLSHFIKRFNYINNVIGSINIINASIKHGIRCFVFTSSIAVYGLAQLPMTEKITPHPKDSYGIAKYAIEQELQLSHAMFGLNFIVFRPHNVYGEYQNLTDKYRNVIGIFLRHLMNDEPLPVVGDGTQTRAFTYIDDVAPVIASAIHRPEAYNQVFNIGSDYPCSINELAEMVQDCFGKKAGIHYIGPRQEISHSYSSSGKLAKLLGYRARHPLGEGLHRMIEWAKTQEVRPVKSTPTIEIDKNLPSFWKT